jgi:hypothetical protein
MIRQQSVAQISPTLGIFYTTAFTTGQAGRAAPLTYLAAFVPVRARRPAGAAGPARSSARPRVCTLLGAVEHGGASHFAGLTPGSYHRNHPRRRRPPRGVAAPFCPRPWRERVHWAPCGRQGARPTGCEGLQCAGGMGTRRRGLIRKVRNFAPCSCHKLSAKAILAGTVYASPQVSGGWHREASTPAVLGDIVAGIVSQHVLGSGHRPVMTHPIPSHCGVERRGGIAHDCERTGGAAGTLRCPGAGCGRPDNPRHDVREPER